MTKPWKLGVVFVALLALAGAAAGIVYAQSGTPPPSGTAAPGAKRAACDQFLAKLAQNLAISEQQLVDATKTTAKQLVDEAVANGKITQDKANKINARIDSSQSPCLFGFKVGRHHGFGKHDNDNDADNATPSGAAASPTP